MECKTPHDLGSLIVEELQKEKFVSGETIYKNLAYELKGNYDENLYEFVEEDLDFLTEQGIIARYSLDSPKNPATSIFINNLCDKLIYHLPRKRLKLTEEDAIHLKIPVSSDLEAIAV